MSNFPFYWDGTRRVSVADYNDIIEQLTGSQIKSGSFEITGNITQRSGSNLTLQSGSIQSHLISGPAGTVSINRDSFERISTVTYGGLTSIINRDSSGGISSVQNVIGSKTIIDTINRDSSGKILSVNRT